MNKEISLGMPISGKVIGLIELNDYLFSKKLMGDGAAIIPTDNIIYSPADGQINLIYETKHALGIKTEDGIQILIHIGLDTARLAGKGFTTYVNQGDMVKKGDKILSFDFEYVSLNTPIETPVVITNSKLIKDITVNYRAQSKKDELMRVILKNEGEIKWYQVM